MGGRLHPPTFHVARDTGAMRNNQGKDTGASFRCRSVVPGLRFRYWFGGHLLTIRCSGRYSVVTSR
jgi:hypothetical protein